MVAAKRNKRSPDLRPSDLDREERAKRTQPMSSAQMALIMSVGEMDAGPVVSVLMKIAGTKKIDALSSDQCRMAAAQLGVTDKYRHRIKQIK